MPSWCLQLVLLATLAKRCGTCVADVCPYFCFQANPRPSTLCASAAEELDIGRHNGDAAISGLVKE